MTDIETLPNEVLEQIFLHLPFDELHRVAKANPSWRNMTKRIIENNRLTAEQQRIINLTLNPFNQEVIKVIGYAGTGKTTALKILCEKNPEQKFFMVVFSDSVKEHADAIFPKNVKCMAVTEMIRTLPIDVLRLLVPEEVMDLSVVDDYQLTKSDMNRTLLDGWMKLWQLQKPSLQKLCEHDVLIVEEGHEIWPDVLDDILMRQKTPKIIVGEPRLNKFTTFFADERYKRSLTFYNIEARETIHLKQVVRYGKQIAAIANGFYYWKNRDKPVIKGSPAVPDRVVMVKHREEAASFTQTAYISFTKLKLFDHVADMAIAEYKQTIADQQAMDEQPMSVTDHLMRFFDQALSFITGSDRSGRKKKTGYLMGGIKQEDLQDLLDLLMYRKQCWAEGKDWRSETEREKEIVEYEHYMSVMNPDRDVIYGSSVFNIDKIDELRWKWGVLESHGEYLVDLIGLIEDHLTDDPKKADFIYCTVDDAKGLEWDNVVLLEDFTCSYACNNLMYTALTRARRQLTLNRELELAYRQSGLKFNDTNVISFDHVDDNSE